MRKLSVFPYSGSLAALIFFCFGKSAVSQCSFTATVSAGSFTSQTFTGSDYTWSSPANAGASDDSRATAASFISVLNGQTDYLKATGFGFNLSAYAGVCGIEVQVEKSGNNIGGLASIQDYEVKLLKDGVVTGTNQATGTNWTNTDSYYTYGASNNAWGSNWTGSDINSANFGVVISAQINGIVGLLPIARIDHITIKVYYAIILPVELISFKVREDQGKVNLDWETAGNNDNLNFIIQRSGHGNVWNDISYISAGPQPVENQKYHYTDKGPLQQAYYRLKIVASSGQIKYSDVQRIELRKATQFIISPNPAKNKIVISNLPGHTGQIKIYDVSGNIVLEHRYTGLQIEIDISVLKPGLYVITGNKNNADAKRSIFVKSE